MKIIKSSLSENTTSLYVKALAAGLAAIFSTMVILTSMTAIIFLMTANIPHNALGYIMVAECAVASFVGGYITARVTKSSGLILGVLCGFLFFLLTFIPGIIKSSDTLTLLTLLKFGAYIISGAAGGIKAVNKKDKLHIR